MGVNNPNERPPKVRKVRRSPVRPPKQTQVAHGFDTVIRDIATETQPRPRLKGKTGGGDFSKTDLNAPKVKRTVARIIKQTPGAAEVVKQAELKSQADDINQGRVPLTAHDKTTGLAISHHGLRGRHQVQVQNGRLVLHTKPVLGLGGSDTPIHKTKYGYTYGAQLDAATKAAVAPVVKALHIAAIPGEKIGKATERLAKNAGAPKSVQTGARLFGEYALDPTMYLTAGRGKAAETLAEKAAKAETVKTAKYTAQAIKVGNRTGISVGYRVHIPFTHKTFEKVTSGKGSARVAAKILGKPIRERSKTASKLGEEFVHDFRPGHLTEAQHSAIRQGKREFRVAEANADRAAVKRAHALKNVDSRAVQDVIEKAPHDPQIAVQYERTQRQLRGAMKARVRAEKKASVEQVRKARAKVTELSDRAAAQRTALVRSRIRPKDVPVQEAAVAQTLKREFKATNAARKERNPQAPSFKPQGPADAQGFVPHTNKLVYEDLSDIVTARPGRTSKLSAGTEKVRAIRQPLRVAEAENPILFERDLGKTLTTYTKKEAHNAAAHQLWDTVVKTGRPATATSEVHLHEGDRVFEVRPGAPPKEVADTFGLPDREAMQRALEANDPSRFVILNQRTIEKLKSDLAKPGTGSGDTAAGRALDRFIGGWKTAVTVYNPTYHQRNLVGDSINAYLADTSAKGFVQSRKVVSALHSREKYRGSVESLTGAPPPKALDKTIKVGKAGRVRIGDEIDHMERLGVIRTGQHGAEVRELLGGSAAKAGRLRAVSEYREDFPRAATYLSARARGMSPEKAGEWSLKHHFDYADLTQVERRLRRVFPFYTFWARNTRLQAEKLLTRPGKYAALGKTLDELSRAAGYDNYSDYASGLKESQQRGIAVPVKFGNKVHPVIVGFTQTDLNNLDANPGQVFDNVVQRANFLKLIPELRYNMSAFFRQQIENPQAPLVPAPAWAAELARIGPIRRLLKIEPFTYNGKKILGWRAKADYAFRSLSPQTNAATQLATSGVGSRNMTQAEQIGTLLTGIRVMEPDPHGLTAQINRLYQQRTLLTNQRGELQQRLGKGADGHYKKTPETERLSKQITQVNKQIGKLRMKRKDPIRNIPLNQRPTKPRGSGSMMSQAQGPSLDDMLGNAAGPSLNEMLGH